MPKRRRKKEEITNRNAAPNDGGGDGDNKEEDEEENGLLSLERRRLEKIKRNNERLASLGLDSSRAYKPKMRPKKKVTPKKKVDIGQTELRRSSRNTRKPKNYAELEPRLDLTGMKEGKENKSKVQVVNVPTTPGSKENNTDHLSSSSTSSKNLESSAGKTHSMGDDEDDPLVRSDSDDTDDLLESTKEQYPGEWTTHSYLPDNNSLQVVNVPTPGNKENNTDNLSSSSSLKNLEQKKSSSTKKQYPSEWTTHSYISDNNSIQVVNVATPGKKENNIDNLSSSASLKNLEVSAGKTYSEEVITPLKKDTPMRKSDDDVDTMMRETKEGGMEKNDEESRKNNFTNNNNLILSLFDQQAKLWNKHADELLNNNNNNNSSSTTTNEIGFLRLLEEQKPWSLFRDRINPFVSETSASDLVDGKGDFETSALLDTAADLNQQNFKRRKLQEEIDDDDDSSEDET